MSWASRALIKNPYGDLLCLEGEDIYTWPLQAFRPCLVDVLYDFLFFYLNDNHWIWLVVESCHKKLLNSIIDQLYAILNFLQSWLYCWVFNLKNLLFSWSSIVTLCLCFEWVDYNFERTLGFEHSSSHLNTDCAFIPSGRGWGQKREMMAGLQHLQIFKL